MNEQTIYESLDQIGLTRVADKLKHYILPAIKIQTQRVEESEIPVGSSKFGGRPDLPANFVWFEWNDLALSFIAQINLAELPDVSVRRLLPETGRLYFFYDSQQEAWGFDPKDLGGSKVLYIDGNVGPLVRTEFPSSLPQEGRYLACRVSYSERSTLPFDTIDDGPALNLSEQESESFMNMVWDLQEQDTRESGGSIHHIFGYPNTIQGEMSLECQLASSGVYCGDPEGYQDPRVPRLERGAKDWMLLLQVDSDDNAEMMWGDAGRIYYWIRKEDLENQDFDKVWTILQCT